MKVTLLPIVIWISIFNLILAVPVKYKDIKSKNIFQISDIKREEPVEMVNFQKRDIPALTLLFQSLNNSRTISLAKTALQLSLTRAQVCNFVGSFIKAKGLESILVSADQSGLALDLVLMILTHYETVDGLTNAIKYGKKNPSTSGDSCTSSPFGSTGLLGGIFNGITSIIGLGNGGSSNFCTTPRSGTSPISPSTNIIGNYSSNASVSSATIAPSTNSGSGGGTIGNVIGGLGSIFGWDLGDSSSSSTLSALAISTTSETGLASSISFATTTSATGNSFPLISTSAAQNTQPTGVSTSTRSISSIAVPSSTKTSATAASPSSTTTIPASSGDQLPGIANGIGGLVSGIFGREDLAEIAEKEGLIGVMKREDVDETELMHQLFKRALDENLTLLQKRDLLGIIYFQIISIIGTNSNIKDIFESLAKSGLAINVVYNALVDSGFYVFDVQLYKYLVNNGYISLTSVVNAALSSGLITHIISKIVANSAYLKLVVNFIIAIFTGGVNVIGLFAVIF